MDSAKKNQEALFRLSILGDLVHRKLYHGELKKTLRKKALQTWTGPDDSPRKMAFKTLEAWYYQHKKKGFAGLIPKTRSDKGVIKAIPQELKQLIQAMKQEDCGRSVPLILCELRQAGLTQKGQFSASTTRRFLKQRGLSGPKMECETLARYRFQATTCGELWQADCCHGPKIHDPGSGREIRVKIFAVIDDRSRLVPYIWAGFHETQQDFLLVLLRAIQRRGIPKALLVDRHGSLQGSEVRLACAKLGIRLILTRPHDGPAKGKIERWWRTLRARVLGRLDLKLVTTLDDINLRLTSWVEADYNLKPHSSLSGQTPLSVWEEDVDVIRWVDDPSILESAFTADVERKVLNDSTCQFRGTIFEVPTHLRRQKVTIHYSLLRPELLWIEDGDTRIFLKEVDPKGNFHRSRNTGKKTGSAPPQVTPYNPVEDFIDRLLHPDKDNKDNGEEESHA